MSDPRRPNWDDYFIEMARLTAARASCPRRRVGAVLVKDRRVIATGYNGSTRGSPHCTEVGCLLVRQGDRESCVRAVHAELNAIISCAVNGVSCDGSALYATDFPCAACAKALVQAGVRRLVYLAEYPDPNTSVILRDGGIVLYRAERQGDGYALTFDPRGAGAPA